jgi:hypothetical protein
MPFLSRRVIACRALNDAVRVGEGGRRGLFDGEGAEAEGQWRSPPAGPGMRRGRGPPRVVLLSASWGQGVGWRHVVQVEG